MNNVTLLLTTLVAIEFFYIMYLETIKTDSATTSRVFNIKREELQRPALSVLFKNQGVYNGFIGAALVYGAYVSNSKELVSVLLVNIIVVASYGALTANKSILLKQGGLAILAFLSLFF